jgi:predicted MFS family arabinose efflux permease
VTPLALLTVLGFVVTVDVRILAPLLPSIAASLAATPGAAGLAMTSYALAYGTGQLVYGPLSDRHGRVAVVRLASLGWSLFTALSALSQTTPQFVATRLVAGACAGAVVPLTLVYIGDTYAYAERQVAIGRFSVVTSAGLAFSAGIGGIVAYYVSWRLMLLAYAVLGLIPALLMFAGPPARPPDAQGTRTRFSDFLADPRARLVYLAIFLEGALLWGGVTYLGAFATHRLGASQLAVGLLIACFGLGTMVGGALMSPIRRSLSEAAVAGAGGMLMALAYLALIPVSGWPIFAGSMLVLGVGYVGLHTTLQLRATEISPAARGKAFALFAFFLFAGVSAGTAVLGRLVDRGGDRAMLAIVGAGLGVIGLGTAAVGRRRS